MRKILFAISLLGALTLVLAASAAAPANFAGTWNLDKAKSQGLSPRLQGAVIDLFRMELLLNPFVHAHRGHALNIAGARTESQTIQRMQGTLAVVHLRQPG